MSHGIIARIGKSAITHKAPAHARTRHTHTHARTHTHLPAALRMVPLPSLSHVHTCDAGSGVLPFPHGRMATIVTADGGAGR
jgi:hypothetical protein